MSCHLNVTTLDTEKCVGADGQLSRESPPVSKRLNK